MDEAEKYQQRLQAIAEKRRQQEEQDRAKRELEDEKLRLQQLKRKSLRDQWLMEGAPLSPTSPEAQRPRSPLWGPQTQDTEKLHSENQLLDEEEARLKEHVEAGITEALALSEAEVPQNAVVQNGENNDAGSGATEEEVKKNGIPLDETAAVLTNGETALEEEANHCTRSTTNVLAVAPMKIQDFPEAEPADVQNVNINEEEEGTVVMRAERVIITEELDDAPESHKAQANEQEVPPLNPEGNDGAEAVEEVERGEAAPEACAQPEKSEDVSVSAEPDVAIVGVEMSRLKSNQNVDDEKKPEGDNDEPEASASVQSPVSALEGTTVASVPVYSEVQPASLVPGPEVEGEVRAAPEEAKAAKDAAAQPGQFQEVSLTDPQEKRRTEEGEQEPLLSQVKAPQTQTEPAAAHSPCSTETQTTTRANPGGDAEAPKRKTCQCCSVM